MDQPIVLDEFHVTLFIPKDFDDAHVYAARQVIDRPAFRARMVRVIRKLLNRYEALRSTTVEVSQ